MYEDYHQILNDEYLFQHYSKNIDFIYGNYWILENDLNKYVETDSIDKVDFLTDKEILILCLYLYKANKSNINGFSIKKLHSYNKLIRKLNEEVWNRYFRSTPFLYFIKSETDRLFKDEQLENEYIHNSIPLSGNNK